MHHLYAVGPQSGSPCESRSHGKKEAGSQDRRRDVCTSQDRPVRKISRLSCEESRGIVRAR